MKNIIEVKKLKKVYKEFTLNDISINLPKGSIMGIIGPNGAGKTTTIKLLMNLLKKNSGEMKIVGLSYPKDEKEIKNRLGYVGEEPVFYQNKTVKWTGKFVSQFYKNWDQSVFEKYLIQFDISPTKKVKHLSKGMKVKLSFAVALSHGAELLIMDEPTSGLDPVIRRDILDLLLKLKQEEGLSVLLSSHITDDIARISDYITYMVDGKIIISEIKDDLLARWKAIHFKNGTINENIISTFVGVKKQTFGSVGITDNFLEIKGQIKGGLESGDIQVNNLNLDDILINLVREK